MAYLQYEFKKIVPDKSRSRARNIEHRINELAKLDEICSRAGGYCLSKDSLAPAAHMISELHRWLVGPAYVELRADITVAEGDSAHNRSTITVYQPLDIYLLRVFTQYYPQDPKIKVIP